MQLIKENEKGKTYQVEEGFKILYRNAWTTAWDNKINPKETIYFISGKAQITREDKTWEIVSPEKVVFPEKTYHKIKAVTDIAFIVVEW